jgi:hypothetical protein
MDIIHPAVPLAFRMHLVSKRKVTNAGTQDTSFVSVHTSTSFSTPGNIPGANVMDSYPQKYMRDHRHDYSAKFRLGRGYKRSGQFEKYLGFTSRIIRHSISITSLSSRNEQHSST